MDLDLENRMSDTSSAERVNGVINGRQRAPRRRNFEITMDESIAADDVPSASAEAGRPTARPLQQGGKGKKSLLEVNSSGIASFSLEGGASSGGPLDIEQREEEERALREVERLRLEMQRASERIHARDDMPPEGTLVKKKKKKKAKPAAEVEELTATATVEPAPDAAAGVVKPKKKKTRKVVMEEPSA